MDAFFFQLVVTSKLMCCINVKIGSNKTNLRLNLITKSKKYKWLGSTVTQKTNSYSFYLPIPFQCGIAKCAPNNIFVLHVHTFWIKFKFIAMMLSFQGLEFTESFTEKRRKDPTESLLFVLQNQLPSPAFLWLESSLRVFSLIVPWWSSCIVVEWKDFLLSMGYNKGKDVNISKWWKTSKPKQSKGEMQN